MIKIITFLLCFFNSHLCYLLSSKVFSSLYRVMHGFAKELHEKTEKQEYWFLRDHKKTKKALKVSFRVDDIEYFERLGIINVSEYGKSKKIAPKEIQEYIECLKGIDIVYADEK